MNKSSFKRMTKRTEFYIFIVMIALCIVIHIASSGQLLVPDKIFTILRAMVVDGIFALCSLCLLYTSSNSSWQTIESMSAWDKIVRWFSRGGSMGRV